MTSNEKSGTETVVAECILEGECAGFASNGVRFENCVFANGESPLKESSDIAVSRCSFEWKYPLWYCENVRVEDSLWLEMARSGVWYTNHIAVIDSVLQAPKNFRRCWDVELSNVTFTDASETLWMCQGVRLDRVQACGDYFAMNSSDIFIDGLTLTGNYCFDGARNIEVNGSKLISKDAFWNTENVVVRDSVVVGEYLGWNSKNLTFINCTIESLQGLCYIENLKLVNCKLLNTTLAFEYSTVEADIDSGIESVLNPKGGSITCESIGELVIEPDQVDPEKTRISCRKEVPQAKTRVSWRK